MKTKITPLRKVLIIISIIMIGALGAVLVDDLIHHREFNQEPLSDSNIVQNGYTPVPNDTVLENVKNSVSKYIFVPNTDTKSGFFKGMFHGIISPLTIPLHVIFENVRYYDKNNDGFWYNLGYFVPAILLSEITIPLFILAWVIKICLLFFMLLYGYLNN